MSLGDVIAVAIAVGTVVTAVAVAALPRRVPIPPVSRRDMQRLLEHIEPADPDGTP